MSTDTEADRGAVRIRAGGSFWQNLTQRHKDAAGKAADAAKDAAAKAADAVKKP